MAHMHQQRKAELAVGIKAVLKKYGMKASIAVRHHSTIVVTIASGKIDLSADNIEGHTTFEHYRVNPYYIGSEFNGESYHFLKELVEAMNVGNWDNSDVQTDFFDVGWYVDVVIGSYDKPYMKVA